MHTKSILFLILTFLLTFLGGAHAQLGFSRHKIPDLSLKHSVKQEGFQYNFEVIDSDRKGIRNHDKSKFYYWFKAQKVMATQGGSSGQLLHGSFESFYTNKQLQQQGKFNKGLKDGEWNYWRENGVLLRTENWSKGTLSGMQYVYNEAGIEIKNTYYYWNKRTEKTLDSLIEVKGNRMKITLYNPEQKVNEIQRFKKGLKQGKQIRYDADGTAEVRLFKKGIEKESKTKAVDEEAEKQGLKRFFQKINLRKKSETKTDSNEEKRFSLKRLFRKKEEK
jgi:antitoxin component YwqK of YwqJK toxin-antitoxin module